MSPKKIICTVTNDLVYDQRMIRICNSLSAAGYSVTLVGRKRKQSPPIEKQVFEQKRLNCFFEKGKLFYAEYNLRLFFYLLFLRCDVNCAIDLDTILPNLLVSKLKGNKRVYDAHELFCEMEEIVSRPLIHKAWEFIEKHTVPYFKHGYTIGDFYAQEFYDKYRHQYAVVRNATFYNTNNAQAQTETGQYILYQGAVNEGRCFEYLIPAMHHVKMPLLICGQGNFFEQTKVLIEKHQLSNKVQLKGYVKPADLKKITQQAYCGITLFETKGKSNYLSMANRFFDYMHAGIPQVCNAYPEYKRVNESYEIAALVETVDSEEIAKALNKLIDEKDYYNSLKNNTHACAKQYCWQEEEKKLVQFYKNLFDE